eukprot:365050-Chlamydomonas_euryale.AAC.5
MSVFDVVVGKAACQVCISCPCMRYQLSMHAISAVYAGCLSCAISAVHAGHLPRAISAVHAGALMHAQCCMAGSMRSVARKAQRSVLHSRTARALSASIMPTRMSSYNGEAHHLRHSLVTCANTGTGHDQPCHPPYRLARL